jgi:hypothetical protein
MNLRIFIALGHFRDGTGHVNYQIRILAMLARKVLPLGPRLIAPPEFTALASCIPNDPAAGK